MNVLPDYQVWVELVLVLSIATTAIVAAAAICDRLARSAVWKRAIWQIAAAGILAFLAVEATGTGRGVVQLCRAALTPRDSRNSECQGHLTRAPNGAPARRRWHPSVDHWDPTPLPPFDAESRRPNEPEVSKSGFAGRLDSWDRRPQGDYGPVVADSSESSPAMDSCDTALPSELEHESGAGGTVGPRGEVVGEDGASERNGQLRRSRPSTASEGHRTEIEATSETSASVPKAMLAPPAAGWPALVWGIGALLVAVPVVGSRLFLVLFGGRGAEAADRQLERRVARLARRLGLRRRVRVLELPALAAPVAFGVVRPTIGLPPGFGKRADREGGEAMLAHELAHLAAGDPIWQLLGNLLAAVLWWQVPVWWLRRRLAATAELAADEASLLVPDGPDRLAAALVELGRRMARPRLAGWIAITGNGFRSSLGRRVERLLRLEKSLPQAPGRRALFCAKTMVPWILIVVMVLGTAWARPRAALAEGGSMMNVLKTSWRASLAGMALVAVWAPAAVDATDEAAAERAAPAVAAADVSADGHLLAQREDADRRENADRERGERDRPDADRERGDHEREHADREEGEHEREHADREEGEREREHADRERSERDREHADRERGERDREHADRERGQRDRPAVAEIDQHLRELNRRHGELAKRAEAIERELRELGDRPGERGEALRAELEKIHGAAEEIEENFHRLQREREERVRGVDERERREAEHREGDELEAHARELVQHRRELEERAQQLRHKREELGDDHPDAAEEVERAFHQTQAEIDEVNRNLHGIEIEAKRRQLARRFEELVGAVHHAEEAGRRDEAERLERQAREVREAMERLGREEAGPHPEQLERAVDELREQVQDLRRAVAELHEAVGDIVDRLEDLSEDDENGDDDREEDDDRDDDR